MLVPLILLAFFLRVWQLPRTPPGLWYDEAYYSMDAAWLFDGGPWHLFFAGNNGREPIFIYLQTLFIWVFGARPLTSRLVAPLVGTLTVPLVYVFARRLMRGVRGLNWLPNLAAAGLAISFWHVGLSRGGYRGILLPLAAVLVFYAFWRGWRDTSLKFTILAGLCLGLSQYTYLAARLLPLVLALFALVWSVFNWRDAPGLKRLWVAMGLITVISAVVFAPLGSIFYHDPELFSSRTGDVLFTPDAPAELVTHLAAALRLFVDGGDLNWRHHLPGRPMLGWLGWLGFWPGLAICLRRFRQPHYLYLIVTFLTLFLPALVSVPPVHALRLSALLPVYYLILALGLIELAYWLARRLAKNSGPSITQFAAAALVGVMLLETGLTGFDYFYRWAGAEETYVEYNGPLVDFVNELIVQTADTAVVIPFQLYVHPTTRYLLHDQFSEQPVPDTLAGPVRLVTLPDNYRMLNVFERSGLDRAA
jgi:4-amino-4-deoxy-L-arabinose transferase-like glycosyltransferase